MHWIEPPAHGQPLSASVHRTADYGTLHGGVIATLVDVVGTLALLGHDPTRPGVSVEMNQSFCAAAKEGTRLHLAGHVLRHGRTLGFTEVTIRAAQEDGTPGKLVAIGRHTKAFPPSQQPS